MEDPLWSARSGFLPRSAIAWGVAWLECVTALERFCCYKYRGVARVAGLAMVVRLNQRSFQNGAERMCPGCKYLQCRQWMAFDV